MPHRIRQYALESGALDNLESKVYLSKKLLRTILEQHRTMRTVVTA